MSRPAALSRAFAVVVVAAAVLAPGAGAKVRTGPAGDAFYAVGSPLPGKRHGDLIWQRRLTGAAVVPGASSTRLVLYRSEDVHDSAVPVSGVVSLPKGKAPKGGWPVITYAHGTTGIADPCAPSRDVAGSKVHPYNAYVFPLLTRWLKAGYAVVRTDYQGLGTPYDHQYLIGVSEGRSTLDIVRAARRLDPRLSHDVVIAGHSQGGHAALFAAALAPKWTPELSVKATVAFAPASHLDEQVPLTTAITAPNPGLTGLIAVIARGLAVAYPSDFDPADALSQAGIGLSLQAVHTCLPEVAANAAAGGVTPAAMFKPGYDFTTVRRLLDRQDPSHLTIRTPLRIEQGSSDQTVIPLFTDQLAKELTKAASGRTVTYKKYPGVDHAGIVNAAAKDATSFIAKQLR